MEGSTWDAPRDLNKTLVKREMAGDSFVGEYQMQDLNKILVKREMAGESLDRKFDMRVWAPLVRQVKVEEPPADSEPGGESDGQLEPHTSEKHEAEEWSRDSDSGIVEESSSEFTSRNLLKEEVIDLDSDSGTSEENTAQFTSTHLLNDEVIDLDSDSCTSYENTPQVSAQPCDVQNPHEVFPEEEIEWQFTDDPLSTYDPLSTEEQHQQSPLDAAVKTEEQQDDEDGTHIGEQEEEFQTKDGDRPPPYWGPDFLDDPSPCPPGCPSPCPPDCPAACPPDCPAACPTSPWTQEGDALTPHPPTNAWNRRQQMLPTRYHCAVCNRWFTIEAHLRRHRATATHLLAAQEKGLPPETTHSRKQNRSWKVLMAEVSAGSSPDSSRGDAEPPASTQQPPPLLPDLTNSSPTQVSPTTPQLPDMPQPMPDGCRVPSCGLLPHWVNEYEWQRPATPGLSEYQLSRTPAADGPKSGLTLRMWRQQQPQQKQREIQHDRYMQPQQKRQHNLYMQQQEQHWQQKQREYQRERYMQRLQRNFCMKQQRHLTHPASASASASAPTSAVTVDVTAGKNAPSYSPRDTTHRNSRQDSSWTVPQAGPGKELQGSAIRSQQQSSVLTVPGMESRRGSPAVVLSRDLYAAEPKPQAPPPPVAPVTSTAAPSDESAEFQYKCPACVATFASKSALRYHKKLFHSGDIYFQCKHCGAKLVGLENYRTHTLEHCTARLFRCDDCPKRFSTRPHLRRHKMMHSGKRPYDCHICGKGFVRKDHMMKHTKTHKCRCASCIPGSCHGSVPQ